MWRGRGACFCAVLWTMGQVEGHVEGQRDERHVSLQRFGLRYLSVQVSNGLGGFYPSGGIFRSTSAGVLNGLMERLHSSRVLFIWPSPERNLLPHHS